MDKLAKIAEESSAEIFFEWTETGYVCGLLSPRIVFMNGQIVELWQLIKKTFTVAAFAACEFAKTICC